MTTPAGAGEPLLLTAFPVQIGASGAGAASEEAAEEEAAQAAQGELVLENVALVTINRPAARNAISFHLAAQLAETLERLDRDESCRCIVITGSGEKAFAAGADIREMATATGVELFDGPAFAPWSRIQAIRTPTIAAVRGWALGGGLELAMMCDMLVAAEDARFGQPEIRIGVIPGLGGTQRLTRAIGKAKAMEMILTGRTMDAREAEACGLVTKVVPSDELLNVALQMAEMVAEMPPVAARAAKEAIDAAFEMPLGAGLDHERKLFYLLFGSEDQREGMAAFLEKREPRWTGR
jgi:enoyl-CoA hydratase